MMYLCQRLSVLDVAFDVECPSDVQRIAHCPAMSSVAKGLTTDNVLGCSRSTVLMIMFRLLLFLLLIENRGDFVLQVFYYHYFTRYYLQGVIVSSFNLLQFVDCFFLQV